MNENNATLNEKRAAR